MGNKKIEEYDKLFSKIITETIPKYLKINFTHYCRDKNISIFKERQLRYFFKKHRDRFDIQLKIRMKDEKEQIALNEWLSYHGYQKNEPIEDFINRNKILDLKESHLRKPIKTNR